MPCIYHETAAERAEAERRYRDTLTGPLYNEIDSLKHQLAEREAMLCAVFMALEGQGIEAMGDGYVDLDDVLVVADWKEAGVTAEATVVWWGEHQKKDEERWAREAAELEAKRAKALKKLTHEERVLLGFAGKMV